ncbi:hypothetical protein V6N13_003045 [Hibiscus sabdariffa]
MELVSSSPFVTLIYSFIIRVSSIVSNYRNEKKKKHGLAYCVDVVGPGFIPPNHCSREGTSCVAKAKISSTEAFPRVSRFQPYESIHSCIMTGVRGMWGY